MAGGWVVDHGSALSASGGSVGGRNSRSSTTYSNPAQINPNSNQIIPILGTTSLKITAKTKNQIKSSP